jgi:hypothetical protein
MTTSTSGKALTSLKARTSGPPSLPSPSYDRGRGAGSVGDIMARLTLFQRRSPKEARAWRRTGRRTSVAQRPDGRCCIWTIRGRVQLGPLSLDQIAKARSSNATVSRWPAGTSTASS